MKLMRRIAAWVLALGMVSGASALGEAELVPQWNAWQLASQSISIRLTAQVAAFQPFVDPRLEQLNQLLSHLSMELRWQQLQNESWSSMAVQVDGREALRLAQRETQEALLLQPSCQPTVTYTTAVDDNATPTDLASPLTQLLGEENANMSAAGLTGREADWLEGAYQAVRGLKNALGGYMTEKAVNQSVDKLGMARTKQSFVIPKEDAEKLPELLSGLSDNAEVNGFLTGLVFSGKQTFTLWRAENGSVLKLGYDGRCGVDAEHLRNVKLNWSMLREDDNTRDILTLKSPAVKGSDRNTLTFKRTQTVDEDGTRALDITAKHEWVLDKAKTTLSATAELTCVPAESGAALTGSVVVKRTEPDDTVRQWTIEPSLHLAPVEAAPRAEGTIRAEIRQDKKVQTDVTVTVALTQADYFDWELRDTVLDTGLADESILAGWRDALQSAATTALIRPLVKLPAEDVLFISSELPPDAWQRIMDAAGGWTVSEEGT